MCVRFIAARTYHVRVRWERVHGNIGSQVAVGQLGCRSQA